MDGKIKDWWEKQKEETDKLGGDPDGKTSLALMFV